MTQRTQSNGHRAYRDDAEYTSPEMQPGHGENLWLRPGRGSAFLAAAMGMPAAGSALAGGGPADGGTEPTPAELRALAAVRLAADGWHVGLARQFVVNLAGSLRSLRHHMPAATGSPRASRASAVSEP